MIKKIKTIYLVGLLTVFLPFATHAVIDVEIIGAPNILLDNGLTYTLSGGSELSSFVVSGDEITASFDEFGIFQIESVDKSNFTVTSLAGGMCTVEKECRDTKSVVNISCPDGMGANTYKIEVGGSETCSLAPSASVSNPAISGGGGSRTQSSPPPTLPVAQPTTPAQPVSQVLVVGEPQFVSFGSVSHTVTTHSFSRNEVTVTIESEPVTLTLKIGESQEIDTDGDGINDMRVTYKAFVDNQPEVVFENMADYAEVQNAVSIDRGIYETTSRSVKLSLNVPQAANVVVSNNANFKPSSYIKYATEIDWELSSGNGEKTVYVRFISAKGSISDSSDTITLAGQPADQVEVEPETSTTTSCALAQQHAYKHANSNAVYYITENCTKRAFNSAWSYKTYFTSWDDVLTSPEDKLMNIPNDPLGFMPKGPLYDPKYGALVKIVTDPRVYLLLGTEKYWITSETVFNTLNYDWGWIEDIDPRLLDKYTIGSEINYTDHHPNYTLVKYEDDTKVYRLEPDPNDASKQVKRHIKNEAAFNALNFRWDRIVVLENSEKYADGEVLE